MNSQSSFPHARRLATAVSLVALGATSGAPAGVIQADWSAAVDGAWNEGVKWSTSPFYPDNGIPLPGDAYHAVISEAGAAYEVQLVIDLELDSLTIDSLDATLLHTAGTLQIDSMCVIDQGVYQLDGGVLDGAGDIIVQDRLRFDAGIIMGDGAIQLPIGGVLDFNEDDVPMIARDVHVDGEFEIEADEVVALVDSTLTINAGGTMTLRADTLLGDASLIDESNIINNGLIESFGSFNGVNVDVPVENHGEIYVHFGRLRLNQGGEISGLVTFDTALADLQLSEFVINTGSEFVGPGVVDLRGCVIHELVHDGDLVHGGDNTFENLDPVEAERFLYFGGDLTGPGDVIAHEMMSWSDGTLNGTGVITVGPDAFLSMESGGNPPRRLRQTLDVFGDAAWGGGLLSSDRIRIDADGALNMKPGTTMTATSQSEMFGQGEFTNEGYFHAMPEQDRSGVLLMRTFLQIDNLGTMEVSRGGLRIADDANILQLPAATLTGGCWIASGSGTMDLDTRSIQTNEAEIQIIGPGASFPAAESLTQNDGLLQIIGGQQFAVTPVGAPGTPLTNSGSIVVGAESGISISSGFTMDPGAEVVVDLDELVSAPDALLAISGAATLAGALRVELTEGALNLDGVTIEVLNAAGGLGGTTFDTVQPEPLIGGYTVIATYGANSVELAFSRLIGDINGDGAVDTADLGLLISQFGGSGPNADINHDGIVDTADLGLLIGAFGNTN